VIVPHAIGLFSSVEGSALAAYAFFAAVVLFSLASARVLHLLVEKPSSRISAALKDGLFPQLAKPREVVAVASESMN
jgi:hypothetical protein